MFKSLAKKINFGLTNTTDSTIMKIIYPCLIFPALIISCSGNKNDSGFSTREKITLTEAVCIMDEIPVYEESRINSPIVSSVQLGEIVQLVNPQTSIQEPDPGKLYKVRLPGFQVPVY